MKSNKENLGLTATKESKFKKDLKFIVNNYDLYIMIVPAIAFYLIFAYLPMYGVLMAFQNYKPMLGISGSSWIGFDNFLTFFNSVNFVRVLKNTLLISVGTLLFSFPTPILLALSINELRNKYFKKTVQTVTYMPHFISLVIICSLIKEFTANTGIITQFAQLFGYSGKTMLSQPGLFVPIYIISGIWQEIGWNSIIYLAALSSIDAQLYEAAEIDGAGKLVQTIHVTLPGILPTITILFILKMGTLLSVGYEKILLLYNPGIYETADVISTYVYRLGFESSNYSLSTAIGLFNSVINIVLLCATNKICDKVNETSLF